MSLHYGYFEGMPRMKQAIANLYTDVVTPEMVLSVHGGTGANSIVCQALCGPGENVVCILPSYQQHYSIPEALGTEVRIYNCGAGEEYTVDLDKIRAMVDENTKMICLTNPATPPGTPSPRRSWRNWWTWPERWTPISCATRSTGD